MEKIREEMEKVARENAIKDLKELQIDIGSSPDDLDNSPLYYALDIAIKALEQQPREDCISREAVLRLVEQYPSIIGNRCVGLMADIKHLPSVTPQRKVGKWDISTTETLDGQGLYECSVCGHLVFTRIYNNYCPNCGADMRESEESE